MDGNNTQKERSKFYIENKRLSGDYYLSEMKQCHEVKYISTNVSVRQNTESQILEIV